MKNIHVIQTDKPSRLAILGMSNTLQLFDKPITFKTFGRSPQNIYITNNQLNCKNSWVYNSITKKVYLMQGYGGVVPHINKIILTTDKDLIKDGVQAIDNEFLEWFVKNPSCEEVEVEKTFVTNSGLGYQEYAILDSDFKVLEVVANIPQSSYKIGEVTKLDGYEYIIEYKIIIPQEEPKQELPQFGTKEFNDLANQYFSAKPKQYSNYLSCCRSEEECYCKEEPKQETLEEVCDKVLNYLYPNCKKEMSSLQYNNSINSLKSIAKWQQERSYSLDEIKTAMKNGYGIKTFSEHTFLKNLNNLKKK
jgi:hypothetical protein